MARKQLTEAAVTDLLYQSLQAEQGGIKVYEQAVTCAINPDLQKEWTEYLAETRKHEEILLGVFSQLGLDPLAQTPGRLVVASIGDALVAAMIMAKATATPQQAELVAGECVVLAETKDHSNWELLGHIAEHGTGPISKILKPAVAEVEGEEDHHYYHTKGWTRELWLQALGFPAVLPPPEEIRKVETAIGASRAEQARESYV